MTRAYLYICTNSVSVAAYSHSIINRSPKPAWLKGISVINIGHYRHFYRKKRASFAGAGDGAICGAATLATPSSITSEDTGGSAPCPLSPTINQFPYFGLKSFSMAVATVPKAVMTPSMTKSSARP